MFYFVLIKMKSNKLQNLDNLVKENSNSKELKNFNNFIISKLKMMMMKNKKKISKNNKIKKLNKKNNLLNNKKLIEEKNNKKKIKN